MEENIGIDAIKALFEYKNLEEATFKIDQLSVLDSETSILKFHDHLHFFGSVFLTKAWYSGDNSSLVESKKYYQAYLLHGMDFQTNQGIADALLGIVKANIHLQAFVEANENLIEVETFAKENNLYNAMIYCIIFRTMLPLGFRTEYDTQLIADNCLTLLNKVNTEEKNEIQAEIYIQISNLFIKKQEYQFIQPYNEWLLKYSIDNKNIEKRIATQNNLAISEAVKGNFKGSIDYFMDSLDRSKKIKHNRYAAQCLINIGTIHASLFNFTDALKRYFTIIDDYAQVIDIQTQTIIHHNIGNIYYHSSQYEEASSHFQKALTLAKLCKYDELIGVTLAHLADVQTEMKNLELAEQILADAEPYMHDNRNKVGIQIYHLVKGKLLKKQKNYDGSQKETMIAIEKAIEMRDPGTELKGLRFMADINGELELYEEAYKYQLEFSRIFHQHASQQYSKQLLDLEIRYELKEKQSQISRLSKENEYQAILLEQSEQISRQNDQLKEAVDELRQFAYIVSHDLKEPVRMISSFSQILGKSIPKESSTKEIDQYIHFITDGATRINALLDELMKYTVIGQKPAELVPVDLQYIVNNAIVNLSVKIEETKANIEVGSLPIIPGLEILFTQVFQNLISNAIKFKQDEVNPHIKINYISQINHHLITISDNGIGIPESSKEQIFALFHRLHPKGKFEGTGMGLAIVAKIVKTLSGKIWVESTVNQGSTFYLQFNK